MSKAACTCGGPNGCTCLRRGEEIQDSAIVLPLFHEMTEALQDKVIASLDSAVRAAVA